MAKKQTFGAEVVAAKALQKKMAKVIVAAKNESGKFSFKEVMIEQDNVQDFIKNARA